MILDILFSSSRKPMISFPCCCVTTRQCSRSAVRVRRTRIERVRAGERASRGEFVSPPSRAASLKSGCPEWKEVRSRLRRMGTCSSASMEEAFRFRSDRELLSISSLTPVSNMVWKSLSRVPVCAGKSSFGSDGTPVLVSSTFSTGSG